MYVKIEMNQNVYICIYTSRAYKEQKKNTNIVYKSNDVHICKIDHTIYKRIKTSCIKTS